MAAGSTTMRVPYKIGDLMIAGLDSSFAVPMAAQADAARAAGVGLWSGYLTSKSNVGIAHPWRQFDFDNARRCGGTPIAYCSGNDDPVACKALAASWSVHLCLDVESGIRGNGSWVQGWVDAAEAGLYGHAPVFIGRRAAFYILAAYRGNDPAPLGRTTSRAHPGRAAGSGRAPTPSSEPAWIAAGTTTSSALTSSPESHGELTDALPRPRPPACHQAGLQEVEGPATTHRDTLTMRTQAG